MSKRRNNRSFSIHFAPKQLKEQFYTTNSKIKSPTSFGSKSKNFLLPKTKSQIVSRKSNSPLPQLDVSYLKKDKVFSQNIHTFRGLFNEDNSSQLYFLTTLRDYSKPNANQIQGISKTNLKPYNVGEKTTISQKTKKQILDIQTQQRRLSPSFYRWHNKTGQDNKAAMQFEGALRDYSNNKFVKKIEISYSKTQIIQNKPS